MRKSLGSKRKEMGQQDISTVTRLFGGFVEAHLATLLDAEGKEVGREVVEAGLYLREQRWEAFEGVLQRRLGHYPRLLENVASHGRSCTRLPLPCEAVNLTSRSKLIGWPGLTRFKLYSLWPVSPDMWR